jgi:hypothetical protein
VPPAAADLVPLTRCGNNIEASSLRSLLESNGIFCYVQGEQHRSMLGMLGAYIELQLMVRRADLEQARELVESFHEALPSDDEPEADPEELPAAQPGRPKSMGVAVLVALGLTFGCAHFYLGRVAWGVILAVTEGIGIFILFTHRNPPLGIALAATAIATDICGALFIIREQRLRDRLARAN